MRKKICLLLFAFVCMFICYEDTFAVCYKITDPDGNVSYNISYDSWQIGTYTIETTNDSNCNELVEELHSSRILNNKVSCGKMGSFNRKIPEITSWIVTIVEILVPVLLTIFGAFDFVKAITGQKDDEIKKGQQIFIKRIIAAVLIFFVVSITRLVVSLVSSGSNEKESILSCIDCFISNKCN